MLLDEFHHREIRAVLGRELEASELETFESLDAISPAIANVVRVPSADAGLVKVKVEELEIRERRRAGDAR